MQRTPPYTSTVEPGPSPMTWSKATNVQVSWQITAVRQDVCAKANPLVAEEEKTAAERGF